MARLRKDMRKHGRRQTWRRWQEPTLLAAPLLIAALSVPLLVTDSGPSRAQSSEPPSPPPDGQFLYLRDCAVCHGSEGQGTPRGQSLKNIGPAEVDYAVSTGRMPIEEPGQTRRRRTPKYTPEETAALVAFTRPFIAPEPDIPHVDLGAGELGLGAELYQAECASCHQSAGEGGALLGKEAPSVKEATPLQVAEAIRAGPSTMPAFGPGSLDQHHLDSVVKYVAYLRSPDDRGGHGLWHLGPLPEGMVAWAVGMGLLILAVRWIGERE